MKTLWFNIKMFFNGLFRRRQQENPEDVYHEVISTRMKERTNLLHAAAEVIAERQRVVAEREGLVKDLSSTEQELNLAVQKQEEELGVYLLTRRDRLQESLSEINGRVEILVKQADAVKEKLMEFDRAVRDLKDEARTNVARFRAARAVNRIQDIASGMSVEVDIKALDTVRQSVDREVGQTILSKELEGKTFDKKVLDLKREAAQLKAKGEFKKLCEAKEVKEEVEVS